MVLSIVSETERRNIARKVLEALTDWFGIEEAREEYIRQSGTQPFFAVLEAGPPAGFLCLRETGKETVELAVTGVLPALHRRGIGTELFRAAACFAKNSGYRFMQVKTVAMGHYEDYDATNRFYQSLGFCEFEVFPLLWDENNPCQIYVMAL